MPLLKSLLFVIMLIGMQTSNPLQGAISQTDEFATERANIILYLKLLDEGRFFESHNLLENLPPVIQACRALIISMMENIGITQDKIHPDLVRTLLVYRLFMQAKDTYSLGSDELPPKTRDCWNDEPLVQILYTAAFKVRITMPEETYRQSLLACKKILENSNILNQAMFTDWPEAGQSLAELGAKREAIRPVVLAGHEVWCLEDFESIREKTLQFSRKRYEAIPPEPVSLEAYTAYCKALIGIATNAYVSALAIAYGKSKAEVAIDMMLNED
jgi:hypothetical protein